MSNKHILTYILTVVAALLTTGNDVNAQKNFIKEYSSSNGLLSADNYMSMQDKEGYVWICSDKGIVRYNGISFKYFTVKNGLPINDIWYINEDSKGRIWLGGFFNGLYYIKQDSIYQMDCARNLENLLFNTEINGTLYFYSRDENCSYRLTDKDSFDRYEIEGKPHIKLEQQIDVHYSKKTDSSTLHFSNFDTIIRISKNLHSSKLIQAMHRNYLPLHYPRRWIIWNENEVKEIIPSDYFNGKLSLATTILPNGYLLLRVNDTLKVYKDLITKERDYILEKKMAFYVDKKIGWLMQDNEANLWVTVYRGKIQFIPNYNHFIDRYFNPNERISNNIHNLAIADENIIFLTVKGKVYQYNNQQEAIQVRKEYPVKDVHNISSKDNSSVYLTFSTIAVQQGVNVRTYQKVESKKIYRYKCGILENDSLYVTGTLLQYRLRKDKAIIIDEANIIPDRIESIVSSEDYFISGGNKGIYFYHKKNKTTVLHKLNSVKSVKLYKNHVLVGTNGDGLVMMTLDGVQIFKKFIDLSIRDIKVYDDIIYLATNKGIYLCKIQGNKISIIKVINYTVGLSSNEVTSLILKDQKLYATTVNGLNIIDIKPILAQESVSPTIKMEKTLVNDSDIQQTDSVFDWNQNNFEFSFAGISYHSLGKISYLYRLKGVNSNWVKTDKNTVRFPKLPAGDYTFEVKAVNSRQIESTKTSTVHFRIKKHYSRTWWFLTLSLLTLFSIFGFGIVRYQTSRTNKLRREKQYASLEMAALQSQMNPHFLFNSLNAIQSVMFLKGEEEANKYIGTFSKLMRITLDNSKKSNIKLSEELDYLNLYLAIEKRRLDNNLNYTIKAADDLEIENILIPCMIFQPLLENALIHGLIPKKDNRNLTVNFYTNSTYLIGEVVDNGIGREQANKTNRKDYKSWASTILAEKIEVLNRINSEKILFEIIDLKESNKALGTKIIIKLPLRYEN